MRRRSVAVVLMILLASYPSPAIPAEQRQADAAGKPILIETVTVPKAKTVVMDFTIGWRETVFIIGAEIRWTNFQNQTLQAHNAVIGLSEGEWVGVTIVAGKNRNATIEHYQLPSKEPGKHANAILREHWVQKTWLTTAEYWGNNSNTPRRGPQ